MYSLSHLNNNVGTSSTLIHSSGTVRLGPEGAQWIMEDVQHRFHELLWSSAVYFFPSPFVAVLFVYALECALITSVLIF